MIALLFTADTIHPSYAEPRPKFELTGDTTIGKHVSNGEIVVLDSVTVYLKKTPRTADGIVAIEIIQDYAVIGSINIDMDNIKKGTKFSKIVARFDDPVLVSDNDFDVAFSYDGTGKITLQKNDRKERTPGNAFIDEKEFPKVDIKLSLDYVQVDNDNDLQPRQPVSTSYLQIIQL